MTLTPIPPAKTVTDSLTDTLKTVADTAHAVADNLQAAAGKVQAAGNFMYTLFQPAPDTLPEPLPKAKAKAECEAEPEPVKPPIPAYFFEDSFLEEECNICHELPTVVNDFDGLMEGKWGHVSTLTEVGMDIINQVSRGELHPIQAMEKFAEIARMFFTAMDYEYFTSKSKESSVLLYKNAAMLVKKYQEEGTFSAYNPKSNCLLDDYVRLMLGLETKSSGLSTGEKFATFLSYTGYVNERIESAQKSLLTTKPMRVRIKEEIEQEKADDKEKKKAELAAAKATQQTSKGLSK